MAINKQNKSTIQLDREVIEKLSALGKKGDTYNDIIKRLLDEKKPKK